jgi:nucleotide-binding universal stress UspA family protein
MSVREILLATDFSDVADEAVRVGRKYAQRFDARVHLFHALRSGEDDAPQLLAWTRAGFSDGTPVVIASLFGDPAEEIVRYAREHAVDLIVLGTHGRTGPSRALLGSVVEHVIRTAPCPVLAVPARWEMIEGATLAASELLSRCLVCAGPSRDLICEPCRAKIRGEVFERRERERHGGLV